MMMVIGLNLPRMYIGARSDWRLSVYDRPKAKLKHIDCEPQEVYICTKQNYVRLLLPISVVCLSDSDRRPDHFFYTLHFSDIYVT